MFFQIAGIEFRKAHENMEVSAMNTSTAPRDSRRQLCNAKGCRAVAVFSDTSGQWCSVDCREAEEQRELSRMAMEERERDMRE